MDIKRYRYIPRSLFEATTFLCQALPKRAVLTFLELLFEAMLTQNGFVTEAWLAIADKRHWSSYYKWLQTGVWPWVNVGLQTVRLALRLVPPDKRCFIAIDDTVIFRCSSKAPQSRIHHQHGQKANRPGFVRG